MTLNHSFCSYCVYVLHFLFHCHSFEHITYHFEHHILNSVFSVTPDVKLFLVLLQCFFFMLFIHLSKSTNQNSACQRFPGCCLSPSCKTRKYPCHDDCYNCFQSCHRYGKELTGSERKTVWIMWGRGKHSQSICSRFVTTVHTTTTTTGVSCYRGKCANKTEVFVIQKIWSSFCLWTTLVYMSFLFDWCRPMKQEVRKRQTITDLSMWRRQMSLK